eukprot:390168-Alexandrium_andersonii.AAC.1
MAPPGAPHPPGGLPVGGGHPGLGGAGRRLRQRGRPDARPELSHAGPWGGLLRVRALGAGRPQLPAGRGAALGRGVGRGAGGCHGRGPRGRVALLGHGVGALWEGRPGRRARLGGADGHPGRARACAPQGRVDDRRARGQVGSEGLAALQAHWTRAGRPARRNRGRPAGARDGAEGADAVLDGRGAGRLALPGAEGHQGA